MFALKYALWGFNNYRINVSSLFVVDSVTGLITLRINNATFGGVVPIVPQGILKDVYLQFEFKGVLTTMIIQCESGSNIRTLEIDTTTGLFTVNNSIGTNAPGYIVF